MTTYFITGGTGFIGRRVIGKLLDTHPDAQVYALVRAGSRPRFDAVFSDAASDRLHPVVGDLTSLSLIHI